MIEHSDPQAKIWAIVPAAGSGQRMGQNIPKQYLTLSGKTILEHTIELLNACPKITLTVLCTASDDSHWAALDLDVLQAVGGDSRAQSVMNGLLALSAQAQADDWVLVHDAARPCLRPAALLSFIDQVQTHPIGGLLAMPCKDTLKQASTIGREAAEVAKTLDRSLIWQAQTPQMFRYGLLREALVKALDGGISITDEASAMEYAGFAPRLIAGDAQNIKVTTPEDLALAEFLLDA